MGVAHTGVYIWKSEASFRFCSSGAVHLGFLMAAVGQGGRWGSGREEGIQGFSLDPAAH